MLQASLRSGAADRRAVFEVFARHLPHGRRYGVVAGTGRLLDAIERFRFGPADLEFLRRRGHRGRADAGFPRIVPFQRKHLGLLRGRLLLPRLADPRRGGHVRRGGAAGNRQPVHPQPRLRDRVRRVPDGDGGRRPAADRDGLAADPRAGRGGQRAGGLHRGLRVHVEPAGRGTNTGCRARGPARTRSRWSTTASGMRSQLSSRRSARARRCWWTPTTCRGRCGRPWRWRAPSWARCGSTAATCRCWPGRSARCSTNSARCDTRIILTGDLDEYSIAALGAVPVDGYGVGTSLVTGSGAPTAALVYKLVARASSRPMTTASWCRWPSARWASRAGAGASGRCGTATSTASRWPSGSASSRRTPGRWTGNC